MEKEMQMIEVSGELTSLLDELYDCYSFLNLPKSKFCKMMWTEIKRIISSGSQEITMDYLKNSLTIFLEKYAVEASLQMESSKKTTIPKNIVSLYLKDLESIGLLTEEEQQEINARILNGDNDARRILLEKNLQLGVWMAKRYYGLLPFEDLIQICNLGLMKAAENYDATKTKFSYYASYWMRTKVLKEIACSGNSISMPWKKYQKLRNYQRAFTNLDAKLGRTPTLEELSEYLESPIEEVRKLSDIHLNAISLDAAICDDGDMTFMGCLSTPELVEDEIIQKDLSNEIKKVMDEAGLTMNELVVITLRFGLDGKGVRFQTEIAKMLNLTYQRIQQIEKKALEKLRLSASVKDLAFYTDDPKSSLQYIKNYKAERIKQKKTKKIDSFKPIQK